jgi:hypothetical protein
MLEFLKNYLNMEDSKISMCLKKKQKNWKKMKKKFFGRFTFHVFAMLPIWVVQQRPKMWICKGV